MCTKFFTELSRVLAKQGIETAQQENNCLLILLDGQPVCRVQADGIIYIDPRDLTPPEANELYHRVAPISSMVHEYTALLEKASLIRTDTGNSDHRLLADFNS